MKIFILVVVISIFSLRPAKSQEPLPEGTPFKASDLDRIEMTIALVDKGIPLAGLPIALTIGITNPTTSELLVPIPTLSERDLPQNTLDLYYLTDDVPQLILQVKPCFDFYIELPFVCPRLMRLPPGGGLTLKVFLSRDWRVRPQHGYKLITQEGIFHLFARLNNLEYITNSTKLRVQRGTYKTSNKIAVNISVSPSREHEAFNDLRDFEPNWILSAPEGVDRAGGLYDQHKPFLQSFVRKHTGSAYATYAKAVLAFMAVQEFRGKTADYAGASKLLAEIKQDPRFVLDYVITNIETRIKGKQLKGADQKNKHECLNLAQRRQSHWSLALFAALFFAPVGVWLGRRALRRQKDQPLESMPSR